MEIKIEIGYINSIDVKKGTATVRLAGSDKKTTPPLRILVPSSKINKSFDLPDFETQVVCIFIENHTNGFILGTWFNDTDIVPENADLKKRIYSTPGGVFELNKETGVFNIELLEKLKIVTKEIEITSDVTINGDVKIKSNLEVSGETKVQDLFIKGKDYEKHQHKDTEPGKGNTGVIV